LRSAFFVRALDNDEMMNRKQRRAAQGQSPAIGRMFDEAVRHHQAGRLAEAERSYRKLLAADPRHAHGLHLLGVIASHLGRYGEAVELIGKAIGVEADIASYHYNLGLTLVKLGRLHEAAACWRRALALAPNDPAALANLGNVLRELGQLDEAIDCHRRAIALDPNYPHAYTNLGNVLEEIGRLEEAEAAQRQAINLKPDFPEAYNNLGNALQKLARLGDAMECFTKAHRLRPQDAIYCNNLLSVATYRDDLDNAALKELHLKMGDSFAQSAPRPGLNDPRPERQLRIGYISSDLRDHPVARNLLPMLRRRDREAFAVFFYAHVHKTDETSTALRDLADGWVDIIGLSDAEAAKRIRADGIDILVSLAGRFDRNRPMICAHRAAPIQVSLHDVATSGLAAMDYLIADRWLVPRHSGEFFGERVLRLPCFPVFERPDDFPPLATSRSDGPPIFGCFNNPAKITPSVLGLWGRILADLPDSKLMLKYHYAYRSSGLRAHFLAHLTAAGGKAEQVIFLEDKEPLLATLARYNQIDVALDCFPFSGSTTSFQALAMGVPVVTWPQDRMVSRWSETMLRAIGLEELIASSGDEYIRIALQMAGQTANWGESRQDIRQRVANSSLCDGGRWARNIERLYRAIWRKHCAA
jgi:protein O-GlcNAc transferase